MLERSSCASCRLKPLSFGFLIFILTVVKSTLGDGFSSDEHETAAKNARNVKNGRKQVQAKIMLQLNQTDKVCAERVMDTWKVMLSTALRDRGENFSNLKEYLEFRIIDSAGP